MVYSLCVWTRRGISSSVIQFFVFDIITKRLVIKNKEPCTKWITLKIPPLVHFRRGSQSLFYCLYVWLPSGCLGWPGLVCSLLCVVAQESQASALRCLQDSLQKHNTMLTVIYSATLHDREIRFVDFTFWSCTSSDYCIISFVCVHWCVVGSCNLACYVYVVSVCCVLLV